MSQDRLSKTVVGESVEYWKQQAERLEAQLAAEERCATESGGILSDICDLVFDDPERASTNGYEGVKEEIVKLKERAANMHATSRRAHDILTDVCSLLFSEPGDYRGYGDIKAEIVDLKNRLYLYRIQVGKYCKDQCSETKNGLGPCCACPLGKL